MESDDGTVAYIFLYLFEHLLSVEVFTVVACHKVPHHDAVFLFQYMVLCQAHMSVGRTEQVGMQVFVGLVGVGEVVLAQVLETSDVVESVVPDTVSAFHHHAEFIVVFAYVIAYHEECGFDVVLIQQVEYPRGGFGNRAIIEGEINRLLVLVHSPEGTGIKPAEQ